MYEANYYPVSSATVIQNEDCRITLLSGQPCGAASEKQGRLEVMIDRAIDNDDGKGLSGMEASVSKPSELKYVLMIESRKVDAQIQNSVAYHSQITQHALEQLFYPPIVFQARGCQSGMLPFVSFSPALPCDVELVNIRPLMNGSLLLLLRRLAFDCTIETTDDTQMCNNDPESLQALLDALKVKTIEETTLTGTRTLQVIRKSREILPQLDIMDLKAFKLHN